MSTGPEIVFPIPKKDYPRLFEFYNKNFSESPWSRQHWNEIFDPARKHFSLGLFYKNDYIGLIIGETLEKQPLSMSIKAIAIDSSFRRNGYGSVLLKKFIEIVFNKSPIEKIVLHFRDSKESRLLKFYADLGFKNHRKEGTYSNGEIKHFLEMTKADFSHRLKM